MFRHEIAVLLSERLAQTDRSMATKVRQTLPFFLTHMIVIRHPGATNCSPPFIGTHSRRVGLSHAVTNVIVITDRVERFSLRVVGARSSSCG